MAVEKNKASNPAIGAEHQMMDGILIWTSFAYLDALMSCFGKKGIMVYF